MRHMCWLYLLMISITVLPTLPAAACDTSSPIRFANGEWSDTVKTVLPASARELAGAFEVLDVEIGFSEPRYEEWAGGEVVDVLVHAEVDAEPLLTIWKQGAKDKAHKRGCGTRTRWAKDFSWKIVDGRDVQGKFRVTHQKWSCGSFMGSNWKNKDAEFNATIWNTFMPRIVDGGNEIKLDFDGDYKDNVPGVLKDLAKFFGNVVSVEPILSEVVKLDESIFAYLKQYRDTIREIERFRTLGRGFTEILPVGDDQSKIFLDLVFDDVRFTKKNGRLVLQLKMKSRAGKALLPSQSCLLKDGLEKAHLQMRQVGPHGRTRLVAWGENAWSIARDAYGDGRFFQLVAAANGLEDPNHLPEGSEIRLEPLAKFLDRGEVLVLTAGDSLWKLSDEAGGEGGSFTELLAENPLPDPELVYPVQVIRRVGRGGSGSR